MKCELLKIFTKITLVAIKLYYHHSINDGVFQECRTSNLCKRRVKKTLVYLLLGHATAQAVGHQPLTAEACVQS